MHTLDSMMMFTHMSFILIGLIGGHKVRMALTAEGEAHDWWS